MPPAAHRGIFRMPVADRVRGRAGGAGPQRTAPKLPPRHRRDPRVSQGAVLCQRGGGVRGPDLRVGRGHLLRPPLPLLDQRPKGPGVTDRPTARVSNVSKT
eukprot:1178585-Prorocentrum_minimum.AAC.6